MPEAEIAERLKKCFPGLTIKENALMSDYVSFKIGGPADIMAAPGSPEDMARLVGWARDMKLPVLVLGNGSNLLVSDEGFRGLVIQTAALSEVTVGGDGVTLSAQCGAKLSKAAMTAYHAGLSGLEFAHGIPGTVGGAVFMNAGAYGGEMSHAVESTAYIAPNGSRRTLDAGSHGFGYRHSWFSEHPENVVLESVLRLKPGSKTEIKRVMDEYAAGRRAKQPLMQPSAGSVFKRPPGSFAGQLIEESGLKGYAVGGAQVSEKHAGFIVNRGGATCRDVMQLIRVIQKSVHARTGIDLEPELRLVGETWNL